MFSRKIAIVVAASLLMASTASVAQTRDSTTPTARIPTSEDDQGGDLFIILLGILAAGGLTFLATQLGGNDDPASP